MKKFATKKQLIILGAIAVAMLVGAFVVFYFNPSSDSRYAISCNYFMRVADVHWAEAKIYKDLSMDAATNGDIAGAQTLGQEQFKKQYLAEQWEAQYQACEKGN